MNKQVITANKQQAKMIIPIGVALCSPAIPTSGETIAPPAKGRIPSKADALPAIFPCRFMASEKPVVLTTPTLDTTMKKASIIAHKGKCKNTTNKSKILPEKPNRIPVRNKIISSKREVSLALT